MFRMSLIGIAALTVACSKPAPTPEKTSASAAPVATAERPKITTNKKPSAPRFKEYDAPADDQLGKLPDGIGLPIGNQAPDATLKDADGNDVQLAELYKKGPVLLVFYRGGWCPYCNFQVRALATGIEELKKRNVTPVVISVDKVDEAAKSKNAHQISFPTLSDSDLAAHEAYRVVNSVDEATYKKLQGYGIDLEGSSGKTHRKIAVPALFLVVDGLIKWAHADKNYKIRPKNEQLFAVLDAKGLSSK